MYTAQRAFNTRRNRCSPIKSVPSPLKSGFTLIELIVVIAVLGILAAVVIVAVNPTEQLSRGRDASRKSAISQLGRAMLNYITVRGGFPFPSTDSTTWMNGISTTADIKSIPKNPTASTASYRECGAYATRSHNGYCYQNNGTNGIIFALQESSQSRSACTSGQAAFYVWSSLDARSGTVCTTNSTTDPTIVSQTFKD